jgi:hypothetical protein
MANDAHRKRCLEVKEYRQGAGEKERSANDSMVKMVTLRGLAILA